MKKGGWLLQYAVTMGLSLGLGILLSQVALFQNTVLGSTKIHASQGVQVLGYGGALFVLWKFGQRLARELPTLWPKMGFLHPMIMPLATLIVMTTGHPVCGQMVIPFLGKPGKAVFNWLFITGMVSAALWLVLAWFRRAAPLLQAWEEEANPNPSESPVESGSVHSGYLSATREEPV